MGRESKITTNTTFGQKRKVLYMSALSGAKHLKDLIRAIIKDLMQIISHF